MSTVRLTVEGREVGRATADASGRFESPVDAFSLGTGRREIVASCDGVTMMTPVDVVLGQALPAVGSATLGVILAFFLLLLLLLTHPFGTPPERRPRPAPRRTSP